MADRRRDRLAQLPRHGVVPHSVNGHAPYAPNGAALTAAAQLLTGVDYSETRSRDARLEAWQSEAWDFYESLGEFNFGVEWFGEACSRVRLNAAVVTPGGDEPEVLEDGVAADMVARLVGGTDGQSQLLRSLAVQLSVPGDSYFVGREVTDADLVSGVLLDAEPDENGWLWTVQPASTMRRSRRSIRGTLRRATRPWELQISETEWVPLPAESLVCRIWDRNERMPWRAISPAKPALPIMREIDMYNRRIMAELVSRVALNGFLFIPDEVIMPASPQYEDAADPFIAELIDIMRNAIKNPGSAASAAPMPLRVPAEYIDKFKHLTFATPLDGKLFEHRDSAIRRLAGTLNMPAEVITGMGDTNHWCVPSETRIFTRDRGWVRHDEIAVGDLVRTMNHDTGLASWEPVLDIYRADVVDEPMLEITGRLQSSASTLTHRWPVVDDDGSRMWRTSETLRSTDRQVLAAPSVELPSTPKYADSFVELVAWIVTDGTVRRWQSKYGDSAQTVIAQSHRKHPEQVVEIRRVLTDLYGAPSVAARKRVRETVARWREHVTDECGMTTWVLNRVATTELREVIEIPGKIVSPEFIHSLTRSQLDLFINAFARGDGVHTRDGVVTSQRDARRLDALELAAVLAGYATQRVVGVGGGFKSGEMTRISIRRPGNVIAPNNVVRVADRTTRTTYTGTIWCPVTPSGTWLAQHNGKAFFTGNSSWQLEESAIKIHISPKMEIVTRCLTVGYLHPLMRAAGEDLRDKDGNRIIIWYDTSELTQRPDRSTSAIELRRMLVINDAATRRETGFDEADAPTDGELEKMILEVLAVNPTTASAALKELTGLELEVGGGAQPPVAGAPPSAGGPVGATENPVAPATGPPSTRNDEPPPPDEGVTTASAARDAVVRQTHSMRRRARESLVRR